MIKRETKFAFTLPEVLITLTVIGAIAAITIPLLIQNYQKHTTAEKLKKAYTTLVAAIDAASAIEPMENWNWCDSASAFTNDCAFIANILPQLNYTETFPRYTTSAGFLGKYTSYGYKDFLFFTGTAYVVILNDGTIIFVSGSYSTSWVLSIGIDVNGLKGPNKVGVDIFTIKLIRNATQKTYKLSSYNLNATAVGCPPPSSITANGWGMLQPISMMCFDKIRQDGWQIKDDYPWTELNNYTN